ncbi:DUF4064 domain-containing protein [Aureivirga sp. CE67]|uniref:DUF4064 domain-containing protein n=1 Tax=Aureivirga sp. CE67 TaxID=1788983 RepID=UPI0018CAB67F|nr:DUF4064 domain-containing protein [Aureivirga sp. CE67]
MTEKGTSSAPMILGIIGGVIGIPSALCAGVCGTVAGGLGAANLEKMGELNENATEEDVVNALNSINESGISEAASTTGSIILWVGIIAAILGLVGGIMGKPKPTVAGALMILAALMAMSSVFVGNLLSLLVGALFLIGGILCFTQKKETVTIA